MNLLGLLYVEVANASVIREKVPTPKQLSGEVNEATILEEPIVVKLNRRTFISGD